MKKLTLLGITVSALLLSNCSNEEVMQQNDTQRGVTLSASINESDSRAAVTDAGVFSWNEGDQISVHTSYTNPVWQTFTLKGEGGNASGTFMGMLMGEGTEITSCAVHPAILKPVLAGNKLTLTLPSSYDWQEGVTNVIMMAKINNSGAKLGFSHLGGLFRFVVKGIPASATKFVFTAEGKKLSGEFTIENISATNPAIVTSDAQSDNSITINFPASSQITERIFYVPVPTGTYNALKCDIMDKSNTLLTTANLATGKEVGRAALLLVPTLTCSSTEGGVAVNASTKNELNSALTDALSNKEGALKSTTVTVTEELSKAAPEIAVPVADLKQEESPEAAPTITVAFDAIPKAATESGTGQETTAIKITDGSESGTSTATKSKATIEIAIPQVVEQEEKPSFEVTVPTATAVLSATAATAEYNKVTASTADNTLIVNKGVTVEELTIKGGSVKIYGTVKKLTIDKNSTTQKVLVYPGASCAEFTDGRESGKQITLSYVPGDSGENEGYTGGNVENAWD